MTAFTAAITTDTWWLIIASWVITLGAIAFYAVSLLRRGRKLSEQVPPEARRWM